MEEMLTALQDDASGEGISPLSNIKHFELIPFANNSLSMDELTELVARQLHDCVAILVVNLGSICYHHKEKDKLSGEKS